MRKVGPDPRSGGTGVLGASNDPMHVSPWYAALAATRIA